MRISVVVCTKDRHSDLKECLLSLARQDFSDFEVIVVDGGTDQRTRTLVESFGFRYLEQKKHTKITNVTGAARNVGIRNSVGEIVAFIDDDAVATSCWVSSLHNAYAQHGVAGVGGPVMPLGHSDRRRPATYASPFVRAVFRAVIHEDPGDPSKVGMVYPSGAVVANYHTLVDQPRFIDAFLGTNMSFQKSWLVTIGFFDEHISAYGIRDETNVCLEIVETGGRLLYVPKAIIYHKMARRSSSAAPVQLYQTYFTDFYFLFKHRAHFSMTRFLIRECILMTWLLSKSLFKQSDGQAWKYALRGRIDAYLSIRLFRKWCNQP